MLMPSSEALSVRKELSNRIVDLSGKKFGKLTVIGVEEDGGRRPQWICQCDCGNYIKTRSFQLQNGRAKSCGCSHRKELSGKRQGRLLFIKSTGRKSKFGKYLWQAKCDF